MTRSSPTEQLVEDVAAVYFGAIGATIKRGVEIDDAGERGDAAEVVLKGRLGAALHRLNPELPHDAIEEVARILSRPPHPTLIQNNRWFHAQLTDGVEIEYRDAKSGETRGGRARLVDFEHPAANELLVLRQLSVAGASGKIIRPDLTVLLNGLPVAVIELKDPADTQAELGVAIDQLDRYMQTAPDLFVPNLILAVSDGMLTRVGSITSGRSRFMPWRPLNEDGGGAPTMEALIRGLFEPRVLVDYLRTCVTFEENERGEIARKIAGYHQFRAVRKARASVLASLKPPSGTGDGRGGVIWHTQGSGKSLTMLMLAGALIREPRLTNPTVVMITDRNDLDDQLFDTFAAGRGLLRQVPVQAESREQLKALLDRAAGGVVFTTIQKFMPEEQGDRHPVLSDRRNIVVIADEAHRSQYDFIDGFARHMRDALPNAAFIGFTGTPIEVTDRNTRAVFGDYISVYDIQNAVLDKATVPIYYESRLARLDLDERERPTIDPEFEEATEGEEVDRKERLKTKWAQMEAIVGAEKRIHLVAADIVQHFEQRLDAMDGKAMIVCMSRRICVDLYRELTALRPAWGAEADEAGTLKIVMTGSATDPVDWQVHIRNKPRREALAKRFRDPADPFRIAIVRDMWLTGFDAPSLHTMYVDKPMRGHGLMQAIARVNRVFRDKPGGLVVDYLGLAYELKQALSIYTQSGGKGRTAINQDEAVAVMLEKYEVCCAILHGFDWSKWTSGTSAERLALLPAAQEHVLVQPEGKERFTKAVLELSQAFALAVPHPEALRIRDDVSFFQNVRAGLLKRAPGEPKPEEELDMAVRQIVSRAVAPEGVVDLFAAAGMKRPDISILSEEFLAEVSHLPQRNLAVELLRKLLSGQIYIRRQKNVVQARSFAEMLEQSIRRYQNRAIEAAQVIQELIELAREMREAGKRGDRLGLTDDELAFYDALETNDSAVKVLGDETLRGIARELVATVRANVTIDWTVRENVRAHLRVLVKRILRKHGYPPDKQEKATLTVLEQAEVLSSAWAA